MPSSDGERKEIRCPRERLDSPFCAGDSCIHSRGLVADGAHRRGARGWLGGVGLTLVGELTLERKRVSLSLEILKVGEKP